MTRSTDNSFKQLFGLYFRALVLLLTALAGAAWATPRVPMGVRNSTGAQRLNPAQLQQVRDSLRRKSGFVELDFDAEGALTLGDRQHIEGGSATARALLIAAVESVNL